MKLPFIVIILFCSLTLFGQENRMKSKRQLIPNLGLQKNILKNTNGLQIDLNKDIPNTTLEKRLTPDLSKLPSIVKNQNYQRPISQKSLGSDNPKIINLSKNKLPSPEKPKILKEN